VVDVRANKHIVEPKPLLRLRAHLVELKVTTDQLATETHAGALSVCYAQLRSKWLELFAPAQTVLHNFDPVTLSALMVYSPRLAELLSRGMFVSEKTLSEALTAEETELHYDDHAHLCTLCLQVVREWSNDQTIVGGLHELSTALTNTIASLDSFIRTNWTVKDLA
jgi:hypothetical protein